MKKLLFIITLLIGFTAISQNLTLGDTSPKPLKFENGKVYQNGEQVPSYELKKILATNLHSIKLYNEAKTKETFGATLLGLGIASSVVDLAIGLFSDVKYPTAITYVGLGMVAVSIPILAGKRKKIEEAVKSYNEGLKNTTSSELDFDMNALVNPNGIGIQIKF